MQHTARSVCSSPLAPSSHIMSLSYRSCGQVEVSWCLVNLTCASSPLVSQLLDVDIVGDCMRLLQTKKEALSVNMVCLLANIGETHTRAPSHTVDAHHNMRRCSSLLAHFSLRVWSFQLAGDAVSAANLTLPFARLQVAAQSLMADAIECTPLAPLLHAEMTPEECSLSVAMIDAACARFDSTGAAYDKLMAETQRTHTKQEVSATLVHTACMRAADAR